MSQPPLTKQNPNYATAASVLIIVGLIGAGLGMNSYFHPQQAETSTTTASSQIQASNILRNRVISLSAFVSLIGSDYVTGSAFGLLGTCTVVDMQNVTMLLPANPTGAAELNISTGRIDLCPISYGISGVSLTFSGQAYADGATLTQLTLTYVPPTASGPSTRTVSTTAVTRVIGLNSTFLNSLPSAVAGLVSDAVASSSNATVQARDLANSLAASTDPQVQAYLRLFPQGANYAAAVLLAGATSGTSYFSSVFQQLEQEFR